MMAESGVLLPCYHSQAWAAAGDVGASLLSYLRDSFRVQGVAQTYTELWG